MSNTHYAKLALKTISVKLFESRTLLFDEYCEETESRNWIKKASSLKAGVFVSIHKNGELRGCIGTVEGTTGNVGEEIISNAIEAAFHDPRFLPLEINEFDKISVKVDILMPKETVESIDQLDQKKYGVIIEQEGRRGLLLPDLESVDSPEMQVRIAAQKGRINLNKKFRLYRFEVLRYD